MIDAPSTTLVDAITQRYAVGRHFAAAYVKHWNSSWPNRPAELDVVDLDDILALPPRSIWFEHAMTANQRGAEFAAFVHQLRHGQRSPGRFLDIHCSFGERLCGMAALGWEVRGLDRDLANVRLAQANCRDRGLADVVSHRDFSGKELAADLGRFDVVAAVDRIEHHPDAAGAIRSMVDLLKPGGLALLTIPNADSLALVNADRDHGLFGLTLLDSTHAAAYRHEMSASNAASPHAVPLAEYVRMLEARGCTVTRVNSPLHLPGKLPEVPARVATLRASFQRYRAEIAPRLPPAVDAAVQLALSAYLAGLLKDWQALPSQPKGATAFVDRYLSDVWTLVALIK